LQSEEPYWLNEAYEDAISGYDTGAIHRNLITQAAVFTVTKILRISGRIIDFGGGFGVLCRLLRDIGLDAYVCDKFADPVFARTFSLELADAKRVPPAMLTAFEVLEHFSNPSEDIAELLSIRPAVFLASTIPYNGEGADWWYIGQSSGQHVFFYSSKALRMTAEKYGYSLYSFGDLHLFTKEKLTKFQSSFLKILLSSKGNRLARIFISCLSTGAISAADYKNALKSKPGAHTE